MRNAVGIEAADRGVEVLSLLHRGSGSRGGKSDDSGELHFVGILVFKDDNFKKVDII